MKLFKHILAGGVIAALVTGCNNGIDPISHVEPGADVTAPTVTLKFPLEGTKIKVGELVTNLDIQFQVEDDIEVKSISVKVDNDQVGTLTDFKDYRRVIVDGEEMVYEGLANGMHTLTITATDIDNKTTTATATFEKAPPYVPLYPNEKFYMSFDADVGFKELVTFTDPTIVGTPTLANEGSSGGSSYKGAAGAYLTRPTTGLQGNEFSAVFWMKVNDNPDRAGVLVMSAPDLVNPALPNNRNYGFRFFREAAGGKQRFKLNVGDGTTDYWFDGGAAADVAPNTDQWVNFAFTISNSNVAVYIDGEVVSQGAFPGVSWTGCDLLSIMSGDPRFMEWGHHSDQSLLDELRLFDKALTPTEIQDMIDARYQPYDGEKLYMTFNGNYNDFLTGTGATVVGTPGFAGEGKKGDSYAGAADSYLTWPTTGLLGDEFSAAFWMKINNVPDRAGILVIGPPDPNLPATPNNRNSGFRFFREDAAGKQRFKLNVGDGTADHWFDGGANADVDPAAGDWVHFAITISQSHAAVYINGNVASEGDFPGVDWTGCDIFSIMSGDPRFMEWGHHSDQSFMDDLHVFNKALTQAEVQTVMNGD
jgi:hypothetical protein